MSAIICLIAKKILVIESFYSKYLGKCFTYFADISFKRESILFLNNDFIEFEMKENNFFDLRYGVINYLFAGYVVFIHNPRILINQYYNELLSMGTNNEFTVDFVKLKITFLSWPYEHDCSQYSGWLLNNFFDQNYCKYYINSSRYLDWSYG